MHLPRILVLIICYLAQANANGMLSHTGGMPGYTIVQDSDKATPLHADLRGGPYANAPTNQFLPMGNGAEARMTVKYFPPGYGSLPWAPESGGRKWVFRPRKTMSSFFLLKWGVQMLCLFNQTQTPRSD